MPPRRRVRGVATTARGPCRLLWVQRVLRAPLPAPLRAPSPPPAPPLPPPPATNERKRKAAESLPLEPHSVGKKGRGGGNAAVTLDEIRQLPPSATRPFYPRILLPGARSIKEPEPWICLVCSSENGITRHLLFNLPAFRCKKCGADAPQGAVDFGFCFADLGVNEICPIGHVKDQEGETCMANALSSSVEITDRIMMVILEQPLSKEGPYIDVNNLLKKHHKRWCVKGQTGCCKNYTLRSLVRMLQIFADEGVKEVQKKGVRKVSSKVHKICDWDCIAQDDFTSISSALSDGYLLVTGLLCGKRIDYLKHGEVYTPPVKGSISKDGKKKPEGHIVVLVGAQQEKKEKFFYFLNSWDEDFCRRSYDEGDGIRGGVGALGADGLAFPPIQILRFNERELQVVRHSV